MAYLFKKSKTYYYFSKLECEYRYNWFKSFNVNTTPIEYKHLFGRFYYYTFTINYEKKSN